MSPTWPETVKQHIVQNPVIKNTNWKKKKKNQIPVKKKKSI